jgi:hypothetical protein
MPCQVFYEYFVNSGGKELLVDVLEERHRELRREISRTTHNEFKSALKEKEKRFNP